jgi:hypothetical protein
MTLKQQGCCQDKVVLVSTASTAGTELLTFLQEALIVEDCYAVEHHQDRLQEHRSAAWTSHDSYGAVTAQQTVPSKSVL